MEVDLTPIIIAVVLVSGAVLTSRALLMHFSTGSKYLKNKMREMEDYTAYQKKMIQHYKNRASNMERPPIIEGSVDELGGLIPELIGQFSEYLPKWAQPLIKDENAQKWIIDYVQKNPDKAKEFFGKMIGKKVDKKESGDFETLSV